MSISYKSNGEDKIEDIIPVVKEQFELNLKKENLYSKMSEMIFLENVFICRIVPRVINNLTRKTHTMTLSNIGKINMPNCYVQYIEKFSFMSCTDGIQLNICSFENNVVISFSSHFVKTEIQKNFLRELASKGIDITIDTNELEEDDDNSFKYER